MDKKVIRQVFTEFAKTGLADQFDINSGGCVLFAVMAKEYFPQLDIIFWTYDNYRIDMYSEANNPLNEPRYSTPSHATLFDGEYVLDSRSCMPIKKYSLMRSYGKPTTVNSKYAYDCAYKADDRNDTFDVNNMETIISTFDQIVSDVVGDNNKDTKSFIVLKREKKRSLSSKLLSLMT